MKTNRGVNVDTAVLPSKENVSELVQRIAVQTVVIFVLPIGEIVAVVQGHIIGVPRISRQDRIQQRTLEPSSDAQSFQEQIEVRTRKWIFPFLGD